MYSNVNAFSYYAALAITNSYTRTENKGRQLCSLFVNLKGMVELWEVMVQHCVQYGPFKMATITCSLLHGWPDFFPKIIPDIDYHAF